MHRRNQTDFAKIPQKNLYGLKDKESNGKRENFP